MTMTKLNTLKAGQELFVSYKGIRPCVFKNIKGKCAFIEFDSGDGTGVRLHRVLASTLIAKDDPRAPKPKAKTQTPKKAPAPKADKAAIPAEITQALQAMQALKAMIEASGYEVVLE